jgi:hypothetical protein
MPLARASAGMSERNNRAGLERGLKGLKATRTSVRKRVIMLAVVGVGKMAGGGAKECEDLWVRSEWVQMLCLICTYDCSATATIGKDAQLVDPHCSAMKSVHGGFSIGALGPNGQLDRSPPS